MALEPGFQHQPIVDRLFEGIVALHQERILIRPHGHDDRDGARVEEDHAGGGIAPRRQRDDAIAAAHAGAVEGIERLAVEGFQRIEHLAQALDLVPDDVIAFLADAALQEGQHFVHAALDDLDGFHFGIGHALRLEEELEAHGEGNLPGGLEVGGVGPVGEQPVELAHHLVAGEASEVFDIGNQGGVETGRFAQIPHRAAAVQVGERGGFCTQWQGVGEFPVEGVVGQIEVADDAGFAVGLGIGAFGGLGIAAGERGVGGGAAEVDADDAGLFEGEEFIGLRDAVLIQIAPEAHVGELGVIGIEHPVAIGIEIAQGIEAVGGFLAVALDGVDAEQFAAVVDQAIAVAVEHEKGVMAVEPAGAGLDAIAVVIEEHGIGAADADGFDAVAVEVEDERVDGLGPLAGLEILCIAINFSIPFSLHFRHARGL